MARTPAKRDAEDLPATTTAKPTWRFATFRDDPARSFRVPGLSDETKLIFRLVATAT